MQVKIANLRKTVDFWQILEGKSAYSEGEIASDIFLLNYFVNLKISADLFYSTMSPLEVFLSRQYLSPVKTELDYIEQRVRLISECRRLLASCPKQSVEIWQMLWLLRFQLYGFGQKLIENGKILYGLIALKEAQILEKQRIRQKLEKLARQNPKFASTIFEFII